MTFLVQMRQSDNYGSVENDRIINLHLGSGWGLWPSIPGSYSCKTRGTFSISLCQKPEKNNESRNEIQIDIVPPWPTYREPRAKKVDIEPSTDSGSVNIKMLKQRRNTQKVSCIVQPGLTYGCQYLKSGTWNAVLKEK